MQFFIIIVVLVVMILAALPLVMTPPMRRIASWLGGGMGTVSETTTIAVRSALQRMSFLSGVTIVLAAVVVVVGDFDFYLAIFAYALAIVAGTLAPLGGSERRRADLTSGEGRASSAKSVSAASFGLSAVTVALSVGLLAVLRDRMPGFTGGLALDSAFGLADIGTRQLTEVWISSVILSLLSFAGLAAAARRQTVAGATPEGDRMIRNLCSWRIAYGALGGQAILLGAVLPALQVLTLDVGPGVSHSVSGPVVTIASLVGVVVLMAGIVLCALAVLRPLWIRPRRRMAAEGTGTAASAAPESQDSGSNPDVASQQRD